MFILMNSRSRLDYEHVFAEVLRMVPANNLQHIVADFEAAFWQAIRYTAKHIYILHLSKIFS